MIPPCPFCGKNELDVDINRYSHDAHVYCECCGARGPDVKIEGKSERSEGNAIQKAWEAWGSRGR